MKYPSMYFEYAETLQYYRQCNCGWESEQLNGTPDEGESVCAECGNDALDSVGEYV